LHVKLVIVPQTAHPAGGIVRDKSVLEEYDCCESYREEVIAWSDRGCVLRVEEGQQKDGEKMMIMTKKLFWKVAALTRNGTFHQAFRCRKWKSQGFYLSHRDCLKQTKIENNPLLDIT
jgi:hypothetical protein